MFLFSHVRSRVLKPDDTLWALDPEGNKVGEGKVKKIFWRRGLERLRGM